MRFANSMSLALLSMLALAPALHATTQKRITVHHLRNTSMAEGIARQASPAYSAKPREALKPHPKPAFHGTGIHTLSAAAAAGLVFGGYPVVGPTAGFIGFDGLNSADSVKVNGFELEPPDQGLATNGGQVLETVNLALQAFSWRGTPLITPVSLNAFFGVPNTNPDGSSNNLSDPRTFYDSESHRWFITILNYMLNAKQTAYTGSQVLLAVSTAPDVLSPYSTYAIDASDASFPGCPCLADQPLVGFNRDGVFLSTNNYNSTGTAFSTALVIALSKAELVNSSNIIGAVGFDGLTLAEGQAFSVAPAFTAPGTWTGQNNGTEFFTSSLDFQNVGDNRLGVWALTNTATLRDRVPNLNLIQTVIPTQPYLPPVPAVQKAGSYPYGQSLGAPEEFLDTNDDRMLQVYYTDGRLYTTLNTSLFNPSGTSGPRTGGAWFDIQPSASFTHVSAHVEHQGYIGIKDGSVFFPSFAVNSAGEGVLGFSFSGTNYFPSTGYVRYSHGAVTPLVHMAGVGQAPDDGFSGYPPNGNVGRWGDYSAAMVSPGGRLFFASEYIPNPFARPRPKYTNWGTFIARVY